MQKANVNRLAAFFLALASVPAVAAAGFDLVDTQGAHHRLADARGRWVVLNFWATWCVPCIAEIPELVEFHRRHPQVLLIGVATDSEDVAKVKRFAARLHHDYPLVLSDDAVERQLGSPRALPTTRIYSPDGTLVYDKPGRVDLKFLEEKTGSASNAQRAFNAFRTRAG